MLFVEYLTNDKPNSIQTWKYSKTTLRDQSHTLLPSCDVIPTVELGAAAQNAKPALVNSQFNR